MECTVFKTVRNNFLSELEIKNIVFAIFKKNKKNGDISVHIVGDKKIRDLNKKYRSKDKVTDVLSFAIGEGDNILETEETDFGDIFVCLPQILRQAKENNISEREEMIRMLVHGVLHILGFDHMQEDEAKKMFNLQEKFVKKML
ncbi:MAG: rRNA maturation RNase YbeY [Candidatus Magasanikbacteria bacterium CG_4_10_14_0_8_um_filter_32_14]|uniref:Endoribonuclease YbeY n=1 Tax=Candidatus Magasanikbacteria bacterium CG_4_10_14_0_8_um_filter_32_14 TaxID=1974640 RepID=A0A2M7RAD6_9BACT|nr:MAG: rRNA maturation RNase YbeY [Candidatus Magasanikbacteria bacterium CG_4_10_14_0_8_um_filter_32_14]